MGKQIHTAKSTQETLLKRYGGRVSLVEDTFTFFGKPAQFICTIHGSYWSRPVDVCKQKYGCQKCGYEAIQSKLKTPSIEIKRMVEEKYGDKITVDLDTCSGMGSKARFHCKNHGEFWVTPYDAVRSQYGACSKCAKEGMAKKLSAPVESLVEYLKEKYGDDLRVDESTYSKSSGKARFICKYHGEFWALAHSVKRGSGCAICGFIHGSEKQHSPVDEVEKDINKIHHGDVILNRDTYYGVVNEAEFDCAKCGHHWKNTVALVKFGKVGCPKCRSSKLEKPIFDLLSSLHCDFDYNKALKGCRRDGCTRNMKPDFLFKKYPLVFEIDGVQHHLPLDGNENFEYMKKNDAYKNEYFKKINYIIIRASDDEVIEHATPNHITLTKLKELINKGIKPNGEIDLDVFRPYDFNRE